MVDAFSFSDLCKPAGRFLLIGLLQIFYSLVTERWFLRAAVMTNVWPYTYLHCLYLAPLLRYCFTCEIAFVSLADQIEDRENVLIRSRLNKYDTYGIIRDFSFYFLVIKDRKANIAEKTDKSNSSGYQSYQNLIFVSVSDRHCCRVVAYKIPSKRCSYFSKRF